MIIINVMCWPEIKSSTLFNILHQPVDAEGDSQTQLRRSKVRT